MTKKSKEFLDKLIQEPAIEKVLRAELKRYKAEEELRQQEAASIAHEARLAKQVEAEVSSTRSARLIRSFALHTRPLTTLSYYVASRARH